ncbi:MAG TPA: ABC transporter permease, partial [Gemmatimonadaceae bacterium]|nr:ABC transporter permease [Gemmatimonadaceae bacterium]
MIRLLATRNLTLNPWRSVFLLFGFSMGVAVMIVLLSIGEALLDQAKDEKLVGGGSITVLPEGVDVEVLKTGGLGGLFFSIDHARFIHQQLLGAPRLHDVVSAAAPQVEGKLLYLRTADGRERAVRASGDIPSLTAAVGAGPDVAGGHWGDDSLDRRWRAPTDAELRHDIDHFHQPPREVAGDPSWGEWHYFNVISPDRQ